MTAEVIKFELRLREFGRKYLGRDYGICSLSEMDSVPVYEPHALSACLGARIAACHVYVVVVRRPSMAATRHKWASES